MSNMNVRYVAREIERLSGPKEWTRIRVGIFEETLDADPLNTSKYKVVSFQQVGEYERNGGLNNTFCAFRRGDKWYALYSKHYMYTRLMSLPDCKDIGGEDSSNTEYANHFCPGEYYVPVLCVQDFKPGEVDPRPPLPNHDWKKWGEGRGGYPTDPKSNHTDEERAEYKALHEKQHSLYKEWLERHPFITKHADFGFVAGCVFGDDTSYKIELIDLREVENGVIKRTDPFGYLELPRYVSLKDAIDDTFIEGDELDDWSEVTLYIARPFRVQLDGSYSGWWVDEKFKKLAIKYQDKLNTQQIDKIKEIFCYFFTRGLDDGSTMDTLRKIDELIDTILGLSENGKAESK